MNKTLLLGAVMGVIAAGCSDAATLLEEPTASVEGPLTATALTGSVYRLNHATFDVFDHSGIRVASVQPVQSDTTLSIRLKPGNYTIVLEPGWVLQRQVDNGWIDMYASVTAQPIGEFWIHPDETLPLLYQFSTGFNTGSATSTTPPGFVGDLNPGAFGTALVSMEVDDCGLYVSKISALASFTLECLGTLDGTQYTKVGGQLVRNFTSCTTASTTALASIDGVLSLQYDRPDLVAKYPKARRDIDVNRSYAAQCIAATYDKWHTAFVASGVNVCPAWQASSLQNPPAVGAAAVVAAGLPAYTTDKKTKLSTVTGSTPSLVELEKAGITYNVSFPTGSPAPNCGTAAQCAAACAGGFRGFVMSTDGVSKVTADPAYWELGNVYTQTTNPFLSASYYHAMADYGPVPGDQFGHAERSKAYQDAKGNWVGEACTYYLSGTRFWTKLIYNKNTTGAVSWCRPPL
jgi:hypothetical protein